MLRAIIFTIFLLFLAIPGGLTIAKIMSGGEQVRNGLERRDLATLELAVNAYADGAANPVSDMGLVGDALKDQLVLRPQVTASLNRRLIALGSSPLDRVKIGRNGYWFQTDAPNFTLVPCAAPGGVNRDATIEMLETYKAFVARAKTKGVDVYAAIIPLSSSVYPQNLPASMRDRCADQGTMLQSLLADGDYGQIFYDLDWFRSQPEGYVFDPRSFHWSREASQTYMHYFISERFPDSFQPADFGPFQDRTDVIDNASDLGIGPLLHVQPTRSLLATATNAGSYPAGKTLDGLIRPKSIARVLTADGSGTERGVLIGDSFTSIVWPYFASNFETSTRFQTSFMNMSVGAMDKLIDQVETDYMLIIMTDAKWASVGMTVTQYAKWFAPNADIIKTIQSYDGETSETIVFFPDDRVSYALEIALASAPNQTLLPLGGTTTPPMPILTPPLSISMVDGGYEFRLSGTDYVDAVVAGAHSTNTSVQLVNTPDGSALYVDQHRVWSGPRLATLSQGKVGKGFRQRYWAGDISRLEACSYGGTIEEIGDTLDRSLCRR